MKGIGHWLSSSVWYGITAFLGLSAVFVAVAQLLCSLLGRRGRTLDKTDLELFPDRDAFMARVWAQRIVNGLYRSLATDSELNLELRNAPELVTLSYAQTTSSPGELLTLQRAYAESGRQLLIVGPPGSGKTTEALKLMRQLLESALDDPSGPVPEIFSLSAWEADRKTILGWLADELQRRHGGRVHEWKSLVSGHRVVPILDGLDEVTSRYRTACLEAINSFWTSQGRAPMVLCCRMDEYDGLGARANFGGAISVCPPNEGDVDEFLAKAGRGWDDVRFSLRKGKDPTLRDLLATPLMLRVAVLAYQDGDPAELCVVGEVDTLRRRLWASYVSAMPKRSYDPVGALPSQSPPRYTDEQVSRWLVWLAHEMQSKHIPDLWVHEWTGSKGFRTKVKIAVGLATGLLALALGADLPMSLAIGLVICLLVNESPVYRKKGDRRRTFLSIRLGLALALFYALVEKLLWHGIGSSDFVGLVEGLVVGLAGGFAIVLLVGVILTAIPFYRRKPNRRSLLFGTRSWVLTALTVGLWLAVVLDFTITMGGDPASGALLKTDRVVIAVLVLGPFLGLLFGRLRFGREPDRVAPNSPTQVLKDSALVGVRTGLASGVAVGLLVGTALGLASPLEVGLLVGTGVGLVTGLGCVVLQAAFRVWLRSHDRGPLGWVRFLNWASAHLLLRSPGASFQWIHDELRDYLSSLCQTDQVRPIPKMSAR